jgi:hypothetical protein
MTILELISRERTSLEILAVQTNSAKELRRAQALIWLIQFDQSCLTDNPA